MSKYEITRKCGHNETINICGPTKNRQGRADWEATKLCYDCYKKEQARAREAQSIKSAEENKNKGLPELVGSEKQISWAESIRAKRLDEINETIAGMGTIKDEMRNVVWDALLEVGVNETSAKKWIDNRHEILWAKKVVNKAFDRIISQKDKK